MKIITKSQKVKLEELKKEAQKMYGNLIKGVVDVKKEIMVIYGKMHSDEEKLLLDNGSKQENLWGINIYPNKYPEEGWIEIDSIINLRPSQGNFSRTVEDKNLATRIVKIAEALIEK